MTVSVDNTEYLNAREAAEYLHVAQMTFAKWRKQFKIKSYTIIGQGRSVFFRKSDLEPLATPQVIPNSD